MSSWEHFARDVGVGLVDIGPTKAEAFPPAALALIAVTTESDLGPNGGGRSCRVSGS